MRSLNSWMVWNKLPISVLAHEFAFVHLKVQPVVNLTKFSCPLKNPFPVRHEFVVTEGYGDIVVVEADGRHFLKSGH